MTFLTGWDYEAEAEDRKRLYEYQDYCGEQFLLPWGSVKERIYDEAHRSNGWTVKSPLLDYRITQDKTNGCVSYGVTVTIDAMLDLSGQKGKEAALFRGYPPFIYAVYHNLIRNRPSSGGCTLSGMMQAVYRYGILPMELFHINPVTYRDGEVRWNANRGEFEKVLQKYGEYAERLQIKVTEPETFDDVRACLKAGYSIAYGTDIKPVLGRDGWFTLSGNTNHGMGFYGYGHDPRRGEYTFNHNSWNDGRGKQTLADVKKQMNRRAWQCFAVLDIERTRTTEPNWSLR